MGWEFGWWSQKGKVGLGILDIMSAAQFGIMDIVRDSENQHELQQQQQQHQYHKYQKLHSRHSLHISSLGVCSLLLDCVGLSCRNNTAQSGPLFPAHSFSLTSYSSCFAAQAISFIEMGFTDFRSICEKSMLPLCSLIGPLSPISGAASGIQATCYARSIDFANTVIFEAATGFAHIMALIMAVIMVLHVRSKFTAVGTQHPGSFAAYCVLGILTRFWVQGGKRLRPSSTYT